MLKIRVVTILLTAMLFFSSACANQVAVPSAPSPTPKPATSTETEVTNPLITGKDWNNMTLPQKRTWVDMALDAMIIGGELEESERLPTDYYVQKLDEVFYDPGSEKKLVAWELTSITTQAPVPETIPTPALPADYIQDTYAIIESFNDVYQLGVGQCAEATLLLTNGQTVAGFSLFETAANNQINITENTIQLWDEINPPSEFRSFHVRYSDALNRYREAFELVRYNSSNRDLQGLIDAIALMEGCAIEFNSCYSEADRICEELGLLLD